MTGESNRLTEQERRLQEAIRSGGEVRAHPAFREDLKRRFVEGTLSEPPRTERPARKVRFWPWVLLPAAAAAAALLLIPLLSPEAAPTWELRAIQGEGRIEIDGESLAVDDPALVAQALSSGGRIEVPEGMLLDLSLGDRVVLRLAEGADVTLPPLTKQNLDGPLVGEVREGDLRIMTGPGFAGHEMHILSPAGRTEIVGTILSVYRGPGYTCVCVLEGTARVGRDEARLEDVPQGRLKVMFDDGSDPVLEEIAPTHEEALKEFDESYRDLFAPAK